MASHAVAGGPESDRDEVRRVIHEINEVWVRGAAGDLEESLGPHFHEEMVIRGQGFQELARGRKACVGSYREFLELAAVRRCTLTEPAIDLRGDTAVVSYGWEIDYRMGGQDYLETGHDLFVLSRDSRNAREGGGWRALWRAMLPSASCSEVP